MVKHMHRNNTDDSSRDGFDVMSNMKCWIVLLDYLLKYIHSNELQCVRVEMQRQQKTKRISVGNGLMSTV